MLGVVRSTKLNLKMERQSRTPNRGICRNLFNVQEEDHPAIRQALEAELRATEKRKEEEYNFNFKAETPKVGGRYDWELVERGDSNIPKAYEHASLQVSSSCHSEDHKRSRDPESKHDLQVDGVRDNATSTAESIPESSAQLSPSPKDCRQSQSSSLNVVSSHTPLISTQIVPPSRKRQLEMTDVFRTCKRPRQEKKD